MFKKVFLWTIGIFITVIVVISGVVAYKILVNAVGFVTVKSPLTISYEGYSFTKNKDVNRTGKSALAFSRMRYEDPRGDYGRQLRQQLVIEAVMNKLKSDPTSVVNSKFLDVVLRNVRSNISLTSIHNLASKYRESAEIIRHDQMTVTESMINGVSYQECSSDEVKRVHNEIKNSLNNN